MTIKISKYPLSYTDLAVTFTSESGQSITSVYGSYNPDEDLPTDDDFLEWLAGDIYLYQTMNRRIAFVTDFYLRLGATQEEADRYSSQVLSSYIFYLDCTQSERDHIDYLLSDLDSSPGVEL